MYVSIFHSWILDVFLYFLISFSYYSNHICLNVSLFFILFTAAIFSYFHLKIPSYLSHLEKSSMLDVSIQGGCILPADDPLWNQSAHCQGAYGHGFRSYVFRVYNIWLCRYAGLPNKINHCRDGCPQDVQPNQPNTKKSKHSALCQSDQSCWDERKRCQHRCCRG